MCWWCLGLALLLAVPSVSWAQAQQRPISEFIDAQTLVPTTYTPWFEPASGNWLFFDAFGKYNDRFDLALGTTFDGRVTVRPIAGGGAHVSVVLHTKNGLCWGYKDPVSPANIVFGNRPLAVQAGAPAALGDGLTKVEFTMPSMDSPLPDFFEDLGSDMYPLVSMMAEVTCKGELRAASGYPDGTPGTAHTTQVGFFTRGVPGDCVALGGCFPAEKVDFKPTGK
jgi:hypothetical protein